MLHYLFEMKYFFDEFLFYFSIHQNMSLLHPLPLSLSVSFVLYSHVR